MLRPVLDPVLGREILARYTTFAGSVGAPAPMEHLAPAGAAQPARYETYVKNLHQVTQAIRKNYLINLQLDLRFLALQLASAVEQAEKTESRRLQMLERQVTLLREENGRLKVGSPAPALALKGEKDARTREIRPFTAGNIARNARLAARTPLPSPAARQPAETAGTSARPGLSAAPAQMVLPDSGRPMTPGSHAPETARGSAPSAEPERTPSRPRASEPAAAPIPRTQPSGKPSGEENRRMTARDLPEKERENPVRPDLPTSHPAPSPVRDPSRSDPARPVSVPLGHTDPNEQDDWAAPLPDPRPARLQRPEPARRILRTDGAERASTRQGTPPASPVSPASSGKTETAPRSGQSTTVTRSADAAAETVRNPAREKNAGQAKTQTGPGPAPQTPMQSSAPQTRLSQSPAQQFPAPQSPDPQRQPTTSLAPEPREERNLRTPPMVHAAPSRNPAAETERSGSGRAKTETFRQESGLPVSQELPRPAAPAPEAAPMIYAASSPGTAEQPGRASRLPADAQRAAASFRESTTGKDPAVASQSSLRRGLEPVPRTAAPAAQQRPASRQAGVESTAAASSRPGQRTAAPPSLSAGKPEPLPERENRQIPALSSALPAAAPPLVHRIPAAGESAAAPEQSSQTGPPTSAALSLPAQKTTRHTGEPGQQINPSGRPSAGSSGTASAGMTPGQVRSSGPAPLSGSEAARPDLTPPTSLRTPPPFVRVPLITTAVPLPEMLSHGVSAPAGGQDTARPETPRRWSAAPLTGTAASRVPEGFPKLSGNVPAVPAAALSGTSPVVLPGQTGTSAGAAGKALPRKTAAAAPGHAVPAGSPAAMELRRAPVLAETPSSAGGSAWESDGIRTVHRTTRRETRQESASTVSVRVPGESVSHPAPQTFGPAEVERIADKVYRQIEDRLRSEKMRRGM